MTSAAGPGEDTGAAPGIRAAARRVVAHAGSLVRLERELARHELKRKGASVGAGAGAAVAAGVFAFYAVGFGMAAAAVALALVVDWWLALLIVFGALLLLTVGLLVVSRVLLRKGTPLKPEQAIEEARLTTQVMRGTRAG